MTKAFYSVDEWLTVPEVAERLNIPMGKVRRYIEEHVLFSVRFDGVQKIPAHLIESGEPLPSLRGTILVLIDAGFDADTAAEWLYRVEDSIGRKPIELLLEGRKSEVRRVAQSLAF
ncbi:MAG: Rv2175c family DNA-binding protein [Rhodoluna sp.]|nr:Rv2175c family DNA-binding protein [Rhodoluna sp.]